MAGDNGGNVALELLDLTDGRFAAGIAATDRQVNRVVVRRAG